MPRAYDYTHSETGGPPRLEGLSLWLFRFEVALTCFCLFMLSDALWGPVLAPQANITGEETPVLRLIWLPVYGATVLLMALRLPRLLNVVPALFMMGLLVGWCLASYYWSIAPDVTMRRTIAVFFTTLFGLYLAARYRGEHLVQIIALTYVALAGGGYLFSIAVPAIGIHNDINAGAWRGMWFEKNQMAAIMVLGFIASCASAYVAPDRRKYWLALAAGIFLLVILSRSKTSLLACLLTMVAFPLLMVLRRGGALSVVFVWLSTTGALIGSTLFFLFPEALFKALGKDPTLTGRTDIWASLMRLSDERPLLGYGYKAFWSPDSVPMKIVRKETNWDVPSAHNGWLDLLVQLGWVGVAIFSLCLTAAYFCALFRFDKVRDGFFSVLILMLFTFLIMSESFILMQNSLIWALFVCAFARLTATQVEGEGLNRY